MWKSIRKDWELYHYLVAQGVAGRWSHVFRPKVDHDDPIWYFQRMNRDGSKGVILTKHAKHGATYFVTSRLTNSPADSPDQYLGGAGDMNMVTTTSAASIETGSMRIRSMALFGFMACPGRSLDHSI